MKLNTSSANEIQRSATLDIAKAIGIALVVFGHNWAVMHEKGEMFRVVFSFHMPLFFFLSGVLMRGTDSLGYLTTARFQSLLKPYFVTLLLVGLVKLAPKWLKAQSSPHDAWLYLNGIFYATGQTIDWVPLWFLPHLFIVSMTAHLVAKAIRVKVAMIVCSLGLLGIGVKLLSPQGLPWSVDLVPITLSFYLAGYSCREFVKSMTFNAAAFTMVALVFFMLHFFLDETIDLNLRFYGDFITTSIQAYSGIYLCFSLSVFLSRFKTPARILSYIGTGTLFILIFHDFFQRKAFLVLLTVSQGPLLPIVVSWVAGLVLPLIAWEFVKRNQFLSKAFLPIK